MAKRATELRKLIVSVYEQSSTSLGSLILRYQRLCSPSMAEAGQGEFPRGLRPRPTDPERSIEQDFGSLLCFHVGNAVDAYHRACRKEDNHLDARLDHLRSLVDAGLSDAEVYGSDREGYILLPSKAARAAEKAKKG